MADPRWSTPRYESRVDRAIREAQERGEFDNLPGMGKPIPGRGEPDDELWWVKQYMRREKLSLVLPETLALRKEVDRLPDRLSKERREAAVRRIVTDLNARIVAANRMPSSGPPLNRMPVNVERVVETWRERRRPAR